jgi:hypothetical protein
LCPKQDRVVRGLWKRKALRAGKWGLQIEVSYFH